MSGFEPQHAPAGSPEGGQFVSQGGGSGSTPEHAGHDYVSTHGGDPKKAKDMLVGFRANVFDPRGIELKGAVGKAFGIDATKDADRIARLAQANEKRKPYRDPKIKTLPGAREMVAKKLSAGENHTATVEAMAHASQVYYKDSHVVLYRGITGTQAAQIIEARKSGGPIEIRTDTTASFTDSHNIASQFAKEGSTRRHASPYAVVVKMRVPRESIVASHKAFKELAKEQEVIVASHGGHTIDAADIEVVSGGVP